MTKRDAVLKAIKEYLQIGGELSPITRKWFDVWFEESQGNKSITYSEFHLIVSLKVNSLFGGFPDNW
jgi:hypothetical protein